MQSAGSTLTSAQIFYAANITGSGVGADTITVTFSCPYPANPSCASSGISQAGVVAVEYSGADINNPLDSVSVGYSPAGNTTALLDSGNVAPLNSNLLVFGAGFADQNATLLAGTGFTGLQHSNGAWGTGGVEDNSAAISGNNVLQRATACIGGTMCPPGGSTPGNWLMQMAVFRDTSAGYLSTTLCGTTADYVTLTGGPPLRSVQRWG